MEQGWIKLHRKMLENPIVMKDADHMAVWVYLLLNASRGRYDVVVEGKRVSLKAGQLVTSRKVIAKALGVNESKVERILKKLESEQQIEQVANNRNRIITVKNWELYQRVRHQNEHQANNKRTPSEHKQEIENIKRIEKIENTENTTHSIDINNIYNKKQKHILSGKPDDAESEPKDIEAIKAVIDYLNEKTGKKYTYKAENTQEFIRGRLKEGHTIDDFKTVIDNKVADWLGSAKYENYLRPETLFSAQHFDSYLNQKQKGASKYGW